MSTTPPVDGSTSRGDLERLRVAYAGYDTAYAERWSSDNAGNAAIRAERDRVARGLLAGAGLGDPASLTVLDLGAGGGVSFPGLFDAARTVRADILLERLVGARSADAEAVLACADGARLPFPDATFDVVVLSTVLSSVLDDRLRRAIAGDVRRVLRPGGHVLWYDFRHPNPGNRSTRPVGRRELRRLFDGFAVETRSVTVVPPLARRLGRRTRRLYATLGAVPPLRSHLLALLRRPIGAEVRAGAHPAAAARPLRFVVLSMYYPPEVGAPQTRLAALVRALRAHGHEVEVVTALPSYPRGRIYDGYRRRVAMTELVDGVRVRRVWAYPAMGSGVARLAGYLSFCATSVAGLARARRPTHVFVESPPLFLAPVGILAARLWRAKAIFNVADLWPDAAVDLGVLQPGLALRSAHRLEAWAYRKADVVDAVTDSVRDVLLRDKRVPPVKVVDLPNGVDVDRFRPRPRPEVDAHPLASTIVYAGTVGYIHAADRLLDAMAVLARQGSPARLRYYASGSELAVLRRRADELALESVSFHEPVPMDELAEVLPYVLAGAVTLADVPMALLTRPSKMFPFMACGRPVLYCGAGEGAELVRAHGAGVVVPNEPVAIADAVTWMLEHPDEAARLGADGRAFVERELSWASISEEWLAGLDRVAGRGT